MQKNLVYPILWNERTTLLILLEITFTESVCDLLWFIADVDEEVGNIFERKGRSRNKRKGTEATSEPVKQSLIELSDSDPEEIIIETMCVIIFITRTSPTILQCLINSELSPFHFTRQYQLFRVLLSAYISEK